MSVTPKMASRLLLGPADGGGFETLGVSVYDITHMRIGSKVYDHSNTLLGRMIYLPDGQLWPDTRFRGVWYPITTWSSVGINTGEYYYITDRLTALLMVADGVMEGVT